MHSVTRIVVGVVIVQTILIFEIGSTIRRMLENMASVIASVMIKSFTKPVKSKIRLHQGNIMQVVGSIELVI